MTKMKPWHRNAFIISALLALASWVMAFYFWNKLPATIPTHFGWNGLPDSWNDKSMWYVFLIPVLQTIITGLLGFLYYKPQYSDMPTTLWLMTLKDEHKTHAFDLIRTMLVGTILWLGVIFTYITWSTNMAGLTETMVEPDPYIILILVISLIAWLFIWTIKVYKSTKEVIKKG